MPDPTDSPYPRPAKRLSPLAESRPQARPPLNRPSPTLTKRVKAASGSALRLDRSTILAGSLGIGLLVGWVGQFGTTLFDRHSSWGIGVALANAGLALAAARLGRWRQLPRNAAWGLAGLIAAGALFVVGAKMGYSQTLGGFEGYALPRHRVTYGPEARDVHLTTSDRTRLAATYLGRQKGERSNGRAVLILPGWLATRQSFSVATLAQWFHPEYDVLVVDPRGQGDSGGVQRPDGSARLDILAGVAYLKAQGNDRIGVLAEREGAYAAVLAASEGAGQPGTPQRLFDSLFLSSPVAHWGDPSLGEGFWRDPLNPLGRITWRLGPGVRIAGGSGQSLAEVLPKVAGTPVLLAGPQEDSEGIVRQLHLVAPEPRSLRLFPGAGMPVSWKNYHRYYESARQFFGMTLTEAAPVAAEGELPPELQQAIQESAR